MSTALTRAVAYRMVCGFAADELLGGVTTIRTVGGLGDFDTRLRDETAAGRRDGPRILAANRGISVPGGHMAGSVAIAAHSIDEALAHPERSKKEGVDLIKLMITGGVLDAKEKGVPGELKMAPEMVRAVCDRAHEMGYIVAAHVESGVRVALENDIPVVLGNDVGCPWITQYDFWCELYYFCKYIGVSNSFALWTVTARSAELAGIADVTGSIIPGKCADMIVTAGNPLDDIRNLRNIDTDIARGRVYDHPRVKVNARVAAEPDKFI